MAGMDMGGMKGMDMNGVAMGGGEHSEHGAHTMSKPAPSNAYTAIDVVLQPSRRSSSLTQCLFHHQRSSAATGLPSPMPATVPLRVDLVLDGKTGAILKRMDFSQKQWIDRVVGTGIAADEGQLFGGFNQLLGLMTTCGLVMLSVGALVMWWRRKPEGALGAPVAIRQVRFSAGLIAFMIAFGLYFPFFGGSMILVGLTERFMLRRIPATQRWLMDHPHD